METEERRLFDAFSAGFDIGYEEGKDDNYPVKWILEREFDRWLAEMRRDNTGAWENAT